MKQDYLTRGLAIVGTGLAWLPILFPVLLAADGLITRRILRIDYLMPAELFPAALLGGALLLWAALRFHRHARLIGGALLTALALLVGGQALAVVTGLASGATAPDGWQWVLVLASLAVYTLALIVVGLGGILLLRDLFAPRRRIAPGGV